MAQLKPLISMIFDCCQDARKHHSAVFEKYASQKFKKAATYVQAEIKKGFQISFPSPPMLRSSQFADVEDDDSLSVLPRHPTACEA